MKTLNPESKSKEVEVKGGGRRRERNNQKQEQERRKRKGRKPHTHMQNVQAGKTRQSSYTLSGITHWQESLDHFPLALILGPNT